MSGALVEKSPPSVAPTSELRLQLKQADFTTAARIAEAVNQRFESNGKPAARAENSALVAVQIPLAYSKRTIEFIAEVEAITIEPDRALKVVVNERTGTIVMGKGERASCPASNPARHLRGGNPDNPHCVSARAAVGRPDHGRAEGRGNGEGSAREKRVPERRRNRGRPGKSLDLDRLHAARHHRDIASSARLRSARSGNRGYLMADAISLNTATVSPAEGRQVIEIRAKLKDAASSTGAESMLISRCWGRARRPGFCWLERRAGRVGVVHHGYG